MNRSPRRRRCVTCHELRPPSSFYGHGNARTCRVCARIQDLRRGGRHAEVDMLVKFGHFDEQLYDALGVRWPQLLARAQAGVYDVPVTSSRRDGGSTNNVDAEFTPHE